MYLPKNIIKDEKMDFLNDDISWYYKMEKTTLPKVDCWFCNYFNIAFEKF